MTPKMTIEPMDLCLISAQALKTLLEWAPVDVKAEALKSVNIAIPQATFCELDFERHIESWLDEPANYWDKYSLEKQIAEHWKTLSAEDKAAQLRYWIEQDYDRACEQVNDQIVREIMDTYRYDFIHHEE